MTKAARLLIAALACLMASLATSARAAEPLISEGFINASVAEVWRLFTTTAGYQAMGATHAEVDLRIGGTIRSHYAREGDPGDANTIVNEILAFEPERMLALRIKSAPADFPFKQAMQNTWSVIYFAPAGEMTQVRIVGLGYGDDAQSQALREFVEKENRLTLDRLAKPYWPKCALCAKQADQP